MHAGAEELSSGCELPLVHVRVCLHTGRVAGPAWYCIKAWRHVPPVTK